MRYPASEKLEIIRLVEQSHLPVKQTLAKIGVSCPTFYRWYDFYRRFGDAGLEDRRAGPKRPGWNRIPDDVRGEIVKMALDKPELSPRELAVTFTDEHRYFVSEASVYRLLKARGLITSPAFIVMKAADEFKDKVRRKEKMEGNHFPAERAEPTLANGLHISKGHRLGLVLLVDDPGRLFALHRRLEAVLDDDSSRCRRHTGDGAGGGRTQRGHRPATPTTAVGQRLKLRRWRTC